MTAPMLMTDCPTEETLAAYVDDRLDAATRLTVTEHLATCGECRELVMMASDFQAETPATDIPVTDAPVTDAPANVVRGSFSWFAPAAGLAAAAVLAIFVLRPSFVYGPDMKDVIAASPSLTYRPTDGRFGGKFTYQKAFPRTRGLPESDGTGQYKFLTIAEEAKDPHVRGVALLHTASDPADYKVAVAHLDEAYRKAQDEGRARDRDAIALDLAAAFLSRWASEKDTLRAIELSEDLLKRTKSPEAAWNRAMAFDLLGRDADAIKAWNEFLAIEPTNSEWARDAAARRDRLLDFMKDEAASGQPKR